MAQFQVRRLQLGERLITRNSLLAVAKEFGTKVDLHCQSIMRRSSSIPQTFKQITWSWLRRMKIALQKSLVLMATMILSKKTPIIIISLREVHQSPRICFTSPEQPRISQTRSMESNLRFKETQEWQTTCKKNQLKLWTLCSMTSTIVQQRIPTKMQILSREGASAKEGIDFLQGREAMVEQGSRIWGDRSCWAEAMEVGVRIDRPSILALPSPKALSDFIKSLKVIQPAMDRFPFWKMERQRKEWGKATWFK